MTSPAATDSRYTISTEVPYGYDEAVERATAELAKEGFGVLTTIDVRATLRTKLDVEVEPYVILGACNPPLAYQGLQVEAELGALLPCNVIVYVRDGVTHVAAMEPLVALGMIGNGALEPVAREAAARMRRVIDALNA